MQPSNSSVAEASFECWSIFRSGTDWWDYSSSPSSILDVGTPLTGESIKEYLSIDSPTARRYSVTVSYDKDECAPLRESASSLIQLEDELKDARSANATATCISGRNVRCLWDRLSADPTLRCRISVRMQAAITLAGALVLKAVYMVVWCWRMRGKMKTRCLTFGDVIAASALNRDLQVPNECLVNAGDFHRKLIEHTCHKHCKSKMASITGDELGHCQKCPKFNISDKSSGLEHPVVATKYKKSLISNLGSNAVVQMVLLSFCSMAMLGVSLYVAVVSGMAQQEYKNDCRYAATDPSGFFDRTTYDLCMVRAPEVWKEASGGWGGYNESVSLAALPMNRMSSETASFAIANGAQLIYSLLYLLVIYNMTLISMEYDWGSMEKARARIRCTIYRGQDFHQSYLLQLPKRFIFPIMGFSALMHWLLGQAISTKEWVWFIKGSKALGIPSFHMSQYVVSAGGMEGC